MTENIDRNAQTTPEEHKANPKKDLPEAAKRALAEAQERRKAQKDVTPAREIGGRGGADPARFGDWEIDGRAIDF